MSSSSISIVAPNLISLPFSSETSIISAKAVADSKGGKIDFKVDKFGIIHTIVGKVSFSKENLYGNSKELLDTIMKLKPASAKGEYVKSIFLSSTMSPSINVDASSF